MYGIRGIEFIVPFIDRVGALQNVGIFFFNFFYIEVFSDPKIDKIKKIWLKKTCLSSCYFSLKIQMRIKNKKKSFTKFFFVQLTKCTFKT